MTTAAHLLVVAVLHARIARVTTLTAVMSHFVGVAQNLVLWLLGLVVDVLHNGMGMVVVLVMHGHMDDVLLVVITTAESSGTDQADENGNQERGDLVDSRNCES